MRILFFFHHRFTCHWKLFDKKKTWIIYQIKYLKKMEETEKEDVASAFFFFNSISRRLSAQCRADHRLIISDETDALQPLFSADSGDELHIFKTWLTLGAGKWKYSQTLAGPLICSPDKQLWLKPICAIWRSFGAIAPVNLSQRLKVDRWNRKRLSCMFFFFLNFKANLKDFPLWIKVGRIMSNRPFFPS